MGRKDNAVGQKTGIRVRPIKTSDFEFIRQLAAKTPGYTEPSQYVLWILGRFHGDFCAIAEESGRGRVGYLLAMQTGTTGAVFVWQFVATFRGQRLQVAEELVRNLKATVHEYRIQKVVFTCVPKSAAQRLVTSVAKRVFHVSPVRGVRLPRPVSGDECEYSLTLVRRRK